MSAGRRTEQSEPHCQLFPLYSALIIGGRGYGDAPFPCADDLYAEPGHDYRCTVCGFPQYPGIVCTFILRQAAVMAGAEAGCDGPGCFAEDV